MFGVQAGIMRWPARWRGPAIAGAIAAVVAAPIIVAAVLFVTANARTGQAAGAALRPPGIPGSVPTRLANLMRLAPVPVTKAPGFTLTDQAGHALSLAGFRGKVVVLQFMDPHCTDICPIVSKEFLGAYRDLGRSASRVVFVAVNVNRYHLRVSDVAAFSGEQGLTTIPSWHFFTGPYPSLRAAWHDYGVQVYAPSRDADVVHSSLVYFIDPQGRERFLASPMADHTKSGTAYLPARQQEAWGHGIALMARHLMG
jgi:cytochrome oxidase Cu insertion factor (SCO1/SenC/PrrC family)